MLLLDFNCLVWSLTIYAGYDDRAFYLFDTLCRSRDVDSIGRYLKDRDLSVFPTI